MFRWAIGTLIIALVAALFGFTGFAAGATGFAKAAFITLAIVFMVLMVGALTRRHPH